MESWFEMGMQERQRTMSSPRKPSKGLDSSSMGPKGSAKLFTLIAVKCAMRPTCDSMEMSAFLLVARVLRMAQ